MMTVDGRLLVFVTPCVAIMLIPIVVVIGDCDGDLVMLLLTLMVVMVLLLLTTFVVVVDDWTVVVGVDIVIYGRWY